MLALRLLVLLGLHHLVVVGPFLHDLLVFLLHDLLVFLLLFRRAGLFWSLLAASLEDLIDLLHALLLEIALDPQNDGPPLGDRPPELAAGLVQAIEIRNGSECPLDEAAPEDTGLKLAVQLVVDFVEVSFLLELDLLVLPGGKLLLYFFLEFDALLPWAVDEALALVEKDALLWHHLAQRHLEVVLEVVPELQPHAISNERRLVVSASVPLLAWQAVNVQLLSLACVVRVPESHGAFVNE